MLFRSYEVFDMQGLSLRNALSPVVFRFTAEQLSAVGRVYSGQVLHSVDCITHIPCRERAYPPTPSRTPPAVRVWADRSSDVRSLPPTYHRTPHSASRVLVESPPFFLAWSLAALAATR